MSKKIPGVFKQYLGDKHTENIWNIEILEEHIIGTVSGDSKIKIWDL